MKYTFLALLMTASAAAAIAQTPTKPAAARPATIVATAPQAIDYDNVPAQLADIQCSHNNTCEFVPPPGIPAVKGTLKTAFTLRYQDIKIGTGALAEPRKEYIIHYTGWLASDGRKFDSSYDHRGKIMDKYGKPIKDANGKYKLGDPQPLTFTQGTQGHDRILTGLDVAFEGMRVGGIRRIIIPYQLAYGDRDRPSPSADYPVGIPPKSDLIFDVQLLAVNEPPEKHRGGFGGMETPPMRAPARPSAPAAPTAAPKAAAPAASAPAQPKN